MADVAVGQALAGLLVRAQNDLAQAQAIRVMMLAGEDTTTADKVIAEKTAYVTAAAANADYQAYVADVAATQSQVEALTAQVADLTAQVAEQQTQLAATQTVSHAVESAL